MLLFGSAGVGYSQVRSAPIEVPFELVANQIIVQVKIGGRGPYSMLLDTDTDPSAIELATARGDFLTGETYILDIKPDDIMSHSVLPEMSATNAGSHS